MTDGSGMVPMHIFEPTTMSRVMYHDWSAWFMISLLWMTKSPHWDHREERRRFSKEPERKMDNHARHSKFVIATVLCIHSTHFLQDFEFIITKINSDNRNYVRCGLPIQNTWRDMLWITTFIFLTSQNAPVKTKPLGLLSAARQLFQPLLSISSNHESPAHPPGPQSTPSPPFAFLTGMVHVSSLTT